MCESVWQELYSLLLRDDLSAFLRLWPFVAATSPTAAATVTPWIATFGTMDWLLSDQGSDFQNAQMNNEANELKVGYHFTTAHCPWDNGSGGRVYREVLRACLAVLYEFRLSEREWPFVTDCV